MTSSPATVSSADLRTRLQAVADDVDGLCQGALAAGDLDLVTRAFDASQAIHCALVALGNDGLI